jgi:hypothetical protein
MYENVVRLVRREEPSVWCVWCSALGLDAVALPCGVL